MRRKIYNELLHWKNIYARKTALLIDGARRVGKSYIALEFAKRNYENYIFIDFNGIQKEIKDLFINYIHNLDTFFMYLSSYYNVKLIPHKTLIIFDEVQLFPPARAAIKYLVADGRYDYIETGSLMSIKENIKDIVIPSEEMHINMYPMDFEEFLWALGNETLLPLINKCFTEKKAMGELMHRKAMDYFRQYLIVGGMPQVVEEYVNTKDFTIVDTIKRNILTLYRNDIAKHASKYETKVRRIFDDIPSQLQRHEKKFKFSSLNKDARLREYEDSLFWLDDAMIINTCFNASEPNVGLKLNMDRTTLKCYMGDTGLLISHAFNENTIVSEEIYKKILFDKLEFNKGMIIENIVAQMLVAAGHKLYFFSRVKKGDSTSTMEIDFLISKNKITNRHNISPIEVKSSKNYTLSSLNKFLNKYKNEVSTPYVIHTLDFKEENNITYLPIYMTPLL